MRQSSPLFFLLLLLLLLAFHAAVVMPSRVLRPLSAGRGEDETGPVHNAQLAGMEGCKDGNEEEEECLDRRAMNEAHLDYIYTQHRPKP